MKSIIYSAKNSESSFANFKDNCATFAKIVFKYSLSLEDSSTIAGFKTRPRAGLKWKPMYYLFATLEQPKTSSQNAI